MNVEMFDDGETEMGKLTGKVALVTGASKGIGAEIAKALAAEGASVAVNYASSREGAETVVASIAKSGGKAVAVGGKVGVSAEVEKLFAETEKALGPVDILVNNAGVYKFSPIEAFSDEDFDWMFDTNVKGLLFASREAVKHFGERGGSIINIGSVVSDFTPAHSSIYTGTKGAVDAITGVLARELGPKKIRVNAVNPGLVVTEGAHSAGFIGSDFHKQAALDTPLGRVGEPTDIAPIVVFLASDDARWVTGELVQAAGGYRG
jgi:3-oxoacyl-[acyl-carrier protein] reductase